MPKFLHEYLEYPCGLKIDNGWWKIENNYLYNRAGGSHSYVPNENDIIAEVNDWDDLDYSYLLKPDSEYGYIDREGNFYGCDYHEHSDIAELYLKTTERELEEKGWIKIYRSHNHKTTYYYEHNLTEAQIKTLEEKNLLKDHDRI